MESVCYRPEELAEILDLDGSHPRRSHLGSCPRCRARLATYEEFRSAPPAVTGPPLEAALSRLGRALDEEIYGQPPSHPQPERARDRPSWLSWPRFRIWVLRPALAAATIVLAIVLVDAARRQPPEPGTVLRSEGPAHGSFELEAPRVQADGALELSWSSVTGADSYRVRLLTPDLLEIGTFDTPSNSLRLESGRIRELVARPGAYAVSVTALREGDEIDRSRPRSFQLGNEAPKATRTED